MEDIQTFEIYQSPSNSPQVVSNGNTPMFLRSDDINSSPSSRTQPALSGDLLDQAKTPKKRKSVFHVTIPKPFRFHTASRSDFQDDDQPKTPTAFGIHDFNDSPKSTSRNASNKTSLTVPRSPLLRTKYRAKPPRFLPTEEQETQEIKQYTFKAKPVVTKIFKVKDLGVPQISKSELTIPTSPAITKPRVLQQRPPTPQPIIKAHPVPDFKEPFMPVIQHRTIDLPNFALPGDEIHKRKSNEIEEKIRTELQAMANARKFKAQPLPSDSPDCLPPRHYYPLTHPKPFKLETESRGEKYQKSFRERLREIRKREKENLFHATPIPNLVPRIPKKPELPPLTKPVEFIFHTSARLEERKAFDDRRKIRESVANILRKQKRKEEEARNAEEIRRLRAELVHNAQPIKHFMPLNIQPSNKRLTKAVSPAIGEKRRKIMEEQKRLSLQSYLDYDVSAVPPSLGRPTKTDIELTNSIYVTNSELKESVDINSELKNSTNTSSRSELQSDMTNSGALDLLNFNFSEKKNLTAFDSSDAQDSVTFISSALQRLVTVDTHSDMQF